MQKNQISGVATHWGWQGDGARKIACIHCALGHSGMWRGLLDIERDKVSALVFDLPAHGKSGSHSPDQNFQDAAFNVSLELLNDQCNAPIDLIGHSFGAAIALKIAQSAPHLLRSLTLIEPVLFSLTKGSEAFDTLDNYMRGEFAHAMKRGDHDTAARIFHEQWGIDVPWQHLPENAKENMRSRMPLIIETDKVTFHDHFEQAKTGALEGIHIPTLLVEGAKSPAIMSAVQDQLEARLPNTTRVRFASARHMLPVTHAAELADVIRKNYE